MAARSTTSRPTSRSGTARSGTARSSTARRRGAAKDTTTGGSKDVSKDAAEQAATVQPTVGSDTPDSHLELAGQDRSEPFRRYAEARAAGAVVAPPHLLTGQARREHVRRTLLEDHRLRIHNSPQSAQAKFDVLASDPFTFFRGTALLYYRDHAGIDGHLPVVFTIGDVHPENFGVMPNSDGAPFFGVCDFDEAWTAPFSYDVKRGALGFWLVAERNGLGRKHRRAVTTSFVEGYLGGLRAFAADDRSLTFQLRMDNSPPLVRDIIATGTSERADFIHKYVDPVSQRFRSTKKRVAHSSHVPEFQDVVDRYVRDNELGGVSRPDDFFHVVDVARKKGSGTGSVGLNRYWVLLRGWGEELERSVVIELKQARRSALYGLVPPNELAERDADGPQGRRIAMAQQTHLVDGDPLYGNAEHDGISYLVRERSPYKHEVDTAELDRSTLVEYANICGQALAQPHARSGADTGIMEGKAEHRILAAIQADLFADDVVHFAEEAAEQVYTDYALFRRDHRLGAFQYWDVA